MRIVIDLLGAPAESGGMRLYAEELVKAWVESAPDDELFVVGPPWTDSVLAHYESVATKTIPEGEISRPYGQWFVTPFWARRLRADAVLSVTMVVSPFVGKRPRVAIVHDWRHLRNPAEFGRIQRAYRSLWKWSISHADAAVQISAKTDAETSAFAPGARRVIIENGRDHARRWPAPPSSSREMGHILTFGHHSNKRPDLVIRAFGQLPARLARSTRLVVLGARHQYADQLRRLADEVGVSELVEFPGFVAGSEYQALVQQASAIVLASTDEGFGLPVSEGNYFGIPVITTIDNGLQDIHPGRVWPAEPNSGALAAAIVASLEQPTGGVESAPENTWVDTATSIRHLVVGLVANDQPQRPSSPGHRGSPYA
jgi:glycosyltransferase involved in cell wall biosynthesis